MYRHNSVSTMSTTGLAMDEVDILMDEVKQAIKQKVSREVTLKTLIETDQELAKARYLSDNEKGAILSMRRVHRFKGTLESVVTCCARLLKLRQDLEAAIASCDRGGILELDLGALQDSFEQALDMHSDTKSPMPPEAELLAQVHKLVGMVEI